MQQLLLLGILHKWILKPQGRKQGWHVIKWHLHLGENGYYELQLDQNQVFTDKTVHFSHMWRLISNTSAGCLAPKLLDNHCIKENYYLCVQTLP